MPWLRSIDQGSYGGVRTPDSVLKVTTRHSRCPSHRVESSLCSVCSLSLSGVPISGIFSQFPLILLLTFVMTSSSGHAIGICYYHLAT